MTKRRILLAEIMHESNTFNRIPTTLSDFESRYYLTGGTIPATLAGTNTEICGFLDAAQDFGWDVTHPLAASASPSGPMNANDWVTIKSAILQPLRDNEAFDAVVLVLHGAMVTENRDDADGDLIEAARALVGPDLPIVVTLDMHANVSQRMVENSTLLMAYRTYPHVDQYERAQHCARLLNRIFEHGLKTTLHFARRPMMDAANHGQTGSGPMPELLALADRIETRPGVLCASIQIGFPWADVADIGPSVVVTGIRSAEKCADYAAELMDAVWDSRHRTQLNFPGPEEAMARARAEPAGSGPLVLADFADNPAGGAYGDSANLLRHMVEADLQNAAFAAIADPESVERGAALGEGAEAVFSLGGKCAPDLTPPFMISARIKRLADGSFTCEGPMWRGVEFHMGPTMVLETGGVEIVVTSVPVAVMDLQVFRSVGIEPSHKATIALKSRNHFRAAYEPVARETMLVDAGGIASMRLSELPYTKIPRPIWPLDH